MQGKALYITSFLVIIGGLAACVLTQRGLDHAGEGRGVVSGFMFMPSPGVIKAASLGYDAISADLIWLKAVQTLGNPKLSGDEVDWCYKALDTLTSVDPYFVEAYETGGLIFTLNEDKVDLANRLLEKGAEYNPDVWQLKYYLGFNYYYFLNDYDKAGKYLSEAAEVKGSPRFLPYLASRVSVTAGRKEFALEFLRHMYDQVEDERLKENYLKRMNEIKTSILLDGLQSAVKRYEGVKGEAPRSLEELVTAGVIKAIPSDPSGGKFYIGNDGKVGATSLKGTLGLYKPKR